jgi:hypothetical protein
MYLRVDGTAAAIESAFYVRLNYYSRVDGTAFFTLDREPSLDFAAPVLRISGLDNYAISQPGAGSDVNGNYQGNDFRNAYLGAASPCASLMGTGQTVGLFELDSYNPTDIALYASNAGLPNVTLQPYSIIFATGG